MVTRDGKFEFGWEIWKITRSESLWSSVNGSWTKWLTREYGYVSPVLLVFYVSCVSQVLEKKICVCECV